MQTRALIAALLLGGPVMANETPLSAIDWLSRSVEAEDGGAIPGPVSVAPLEAAPVAIGLESPDSLGLPEDIWLASDAETLAGLLGRMPAEMPLPLRNTLATLVSLRAPVEDPQDTFLVARIDTLLSLGRTDAARALIHAADEDTPPLLRREFDISLLTGHENDICRDLGVRSDMAPTYPARIFCLARLGDWQAAALTLETAHALNVLTEDEDILLGRFLDDGEEDFLPPPERPATVTPLVFRLYEAIGEPLATRQLPLAFAHADLRHHHGWKTRLEAAERLYRAGAISNEDMLELYLERAPAASGGVWDRAAAVQAWMHADDEDRNAERQAAAEVLMSAGLGRLVGAHDAQDRGATVDANVELDKDVEALIEDDRPGEAALHAILRAAEAWDGDPDDLARALAALRAVGFAPLEAEATAQWAANR